MKFTIYDLRFMSGLLAVAAFLAGCASRPEPIGQNHNGQNHAVAAAAVAADPSPSRMILPAMILPIPTHSVSLAWTASPSTNVTGYFVYYGNVETMGMTQHPAGLALTTTITNLPPVLHYFYATAHDAWGIESEPSNVITHTPGDPAPPAELRIVVTPQVAGAPDGPWLAVPQWPALTLTNPTGMRFYRMGISQ